MSSLAVSSSRSTTPGGVQTSTSFSPFLVADTVVTSVTTFMSAPLANRGAERSIRAVRDHQRGALHQQDSQRRILIDPALGEVLQRLQTGLLILDGAVVLHAIEIGACQDHRVVGNHGALDTGIVDVPLLVHPESLLANRTLEAEAELGELHCRNAVHRRADRARVQLLLHLRIIAEQAPGL